MISKEQVKHIAKLARIKLTEKEEEKFSHELSSILGFVGELNKVDTEGVEPMAQVSGLTNAFREDSAGIPADEERGQRFVDAAPQKEGRLVKVKSVLKRIN